MRLVRSLIRVLVKDSGDASWTQERASLALEALMRAVGTFSDKSSGKGFWGRLLDAGKSFLGVGGSNKYAAAKGFLGESTS
nr:MAG TPA: hypothetical protein [Caudoviricetes sp.]